MVCFGTPRILLISLAENLIFVKISGSFGIMKPGLHFSPVKQGRGPHTLCCIAIQYIAVNIIQYFFHTLKVLYTVNKIGYFHDAGFSYRQARINQKTNCL